METTLEDPIFEIEDGELLEMMEEAYGNRERGGPETGVGPDILGTGEEN